jgi:hypothetical protein
MTDPKVSTADGTVTPHDAYVSLLTRSGHFGNEGPPPALPQLRPVETSEALRAFAEAPTNEVPNSVRLSVLYDLARQGFPDRDPANDEYRHLAQSVIGRRKVDPEQLLQDLRSASTDGKPFHTTSTAQALKAEEVAFIGESVCTVHQVKVGDLVGTWLYSEFDTDADFKSVSEWVDPRKWPKLAPFMFKKMDVVGAPEPLAIPEEGTDHWHGVFHEEVQLFDRVSAILHCDHRTVGNRLAGMTFELTFSPDGQLDVDRGYITVTNTEPETGVKGCRVQALKIVGFTDDGWDVVARYVCPYWTDFLRAAVQGGKSAPTPRDPSLPPPAPGPDPGDLLGEWTEFLGATARTYLDLFEGVNARAVSRSYSPSDWLADGSRFWSQMAKDWAQAWTYGLERLPEAARDPGGTVFARPPRPATASSSATPRPTASVAGRRAAAPPGPAADRPPGLDELIVPVPGLGEQERPVVSDLRSIEAGAATIPAAAVSVAVVSLPDGTPGVRLRTSDTSAPPGLYVGSLLPAAGAPNAVPVQFYVSGARER